MRSKIFSNKFWTDFIKKQQPKNTEENEITNQDQPEQDSITIPLKESESINEVKEEPLLLPILVQSELNLEKNLIFTVAAYRGKSRKIIHTDKLSDGSIIQRTVVIGKTKSGIETGVLTTYHFKIYLTLVELWEKAGKPINEPVHFTTYKLIKRLDLSDDGRTYEKVRTALYDLRQIPIEFIHSFYMPQEGSFSSLEPLSILNHLRIYERKKAGKNEKVRGYGEFQFDRYIVENILNDYVHPLRLDIIKSFKKHKDLSILLYTYLDRQLAYQNKFEIRLENLFDNLDLSQDYVRYPAERKRVIDPVLKEVRSKALSTGILTHLVVNKTKRGDDYKLVAQKFPFKVMQESNKSIEKTTLKAQENEDETLKDQVADYKNNLNPEERKILREKATNELINTPGILEVFITDTLTEIKENEIIRAIITEDRD